MFFCVRSLARYLSPNPLASIGPKIKSTPRHLLFHTMTDAVEHDSANEAETTPDFPLHPSIPISYGNEGEGEENKAPGLRTRHLMMMKMMCPFASRGENASRRPRE